MSQFGGDLDLALAAARAGQERGFAELWQGLQPAVFRYLQAVAGDAASEIAVATWQEAAAEVRRFRGDATGFRVWLFRVARYRALEEVRRAGRGGVADQPTNQSHPHAASHAAPHAAPRAALEKRNGITDNAPVEVDDGGPRGMDATVGAGPATVTAPSGGADRVGSGATMVPGTQAAPPGPPATERALRLMARLPREESEAVLLRVVAGLDVAQSAMVLGVRDEAARTAAARGLRALAVIAAEAPADSEDGWRRVWSSE